MEAFRAIIVAAKPNRDVSRAVVQDADDVVCNPIEGPMLSSDCDDGPEQPCGDRRTHDQREEVEARSP